MAQSLPRLFVSPPIGEGRNIEISTSQSHYLLHVLRLSEGKQVLVFDTENGEWLTEIVEAKRSSLVLRPIERVRAQTQPQDLHYLFAPLKQARLDYMVQKAVELGVSALQPVITAYTDVSRLNPERMRANAIEAAEQCGLLSLPEIRPAVKLQQMLKLWPHDRAIIFCDEHAPQAPALPTLQRVTQAEIAVLIGPEGGFSPAERDTLLSREFVYGISLGPRVMRADTAAVAALTLINAVLGDWR